MYFIYLHCQTLLEFDFSSGHARGRRVDAKKHRKELEKLIKASDQKAGDSGYDDGLEEEDDAIELLGEGSSSVINVFK